MRNGCEPAHLSPALRGSSRHRAPLSARHQASFHQLQKQPDQAPAPAPPRHDFRGVVLPVRSNLFFLACLCPWAQRGPEPTATSYPQQTRSQRAPEEETAGTRGWPSTWAFAWPAPPMRPSPAAASQQFAPVPAGWGAGKGGTARSPAHGWGGGGGPAVAAGPPSLPSPPTTGPRGKGQHLQGAHARKDVLPGDLAGPDKTPTRRKAPRGPPGPTTQGESPFLGLIRQDPGTQSRRSRPHQRAGLVGNLDCAPPPSRRTCGHT